MKKSELKNIIKECVKEVIFEEGVLSGIITEVAQGLVNSQQPLLESAPQPLRSSPPPRTNSADRQVRAAMAANSYEEVKKKFSNPELFEGTQPLPSQKTGKGGALQGVAPGDAGVDITNIPGFGNWGNVASNI